jgi:hypothetical protein
VVGAAVALGLDDDEDLAVLHHHGVGPGVVGEGVERAARGQVEAGVVPVAGDQALLDRAPVEGEPHVGTAVVEGVGHALVPEDAHAVSSRLAHQAASGPQVIQTADGDSHRDEA